MQFRRWSPALTILLLSCAHRHASTRGAVAPSIWTEPVTRMEFVRVPGGCFRMGDVFGDGEEEETPVHEVCLRPFLIGRYEVTRDEWRRVMGSDPSRDARCDSGRCPVDSVRWGEVQTFLARLGGAGVSYRLPTEAEWEYAARSGGQEERYAGGHAVDAVAWYAENSGRKNHPVGTRAPNGLGLHDMSGNVWEWTGDWYADDAYARSPRDAPTGPEQRAGQDEEDHVIRGGCKTGEAHNARTVRRTSGYRLASGAASDKIGFRVARTP